MTVQDIAGAPAEIPATEGTESVSSPESTATEAVEPERDWKAEADKWKEMSRKTENAAKQAMKELDQLRTAQMTDSEKAITEAEKRGREAMMRELGSQIAEAKMRAAAIGKVADVDALIELVDVAKFVTADGVDDSAIEATIERFAKVAPPQPAPPKFGSVELGPQGGRPRQVGEAELSRMTPEQIVQARQSGQLDDLLGVTS